MPAGYGMNTEPAWRAAALRRGPNHRLCVRCKDYKHPKGGIAPNKRFQCAECRTDEPTEPRLWTTAEGDFVMENRQRMTVRAMSLKLKRSASSVRNYIERRGA